MTERAGSTPIAHRRVVWDQRAKRALQEGDADEANALLRLAAKLDARTHPGQTVPGIFVDTRRKAA